MKIGTIRFVHLTHLETVIYGTLWGVVGLEEDIIQGTEVTVIKKGVKGGEEVILGPIINRVEAAGQGSYRYAVALFDKIDRHPSAFKETP